MPATDDRATPASPDQALESNLPPAGARIAAFAAIVVAGICGGLIGWAVTDLQVSGDSTVWAGVGGLIGALIAAGGVAVVAVLVLRAMGEWRTIQQRADSPDAPGRRPS